MNTPGGYEVSEPLTRIEPRPEERCLMRELDRVERAGVGEIMHRRHHHCLWCDREFSTLLKLDRHLMDTGEMGRDEAEALGFCLGLFDRRYPHKALERGRGWDHAPARVN